MRVLVTGAFGYVGGRVSKFLSDVGVEIVLGSRSNRSSPHWVPTSEIFVMDWENSSSLEEACAGVDAVIHCAGMNAQDCQLDPVLALTFNGVSTARLVRAASKVGVKKFIYFSTAHVYKAPLSGKISVSDCPTNIHPYATSHLAGEHAILYESERNNRLRGVVLRLSNVVGAPMHKSVNCWSLVSNDLCLQAITSGRMKIRSLGHQERDFFSMRMVQEVVWGLLNDVDKGGHVYNVGSGFSISIRELAYLIQERCFQLELYRPEIVFERGASVIADKLEGKLAFDSDFHAGKFDISSDIDETLLFCKENFS